MTSSTKVSPYAHKLAITLAGTTATLLPLCLVMLCARISVRCKQAKFGWEDGFVIAGFTLTIVVCILQFNQYAYCFNNDFIQPATLSRSAKVSLAGVLVWASAMFCTKTSVALLLLRFQQARCWRVVLWAVVALQAAAATSSIFFSLVRCRPLQALWKPNIPGAKCVPFSTVLIFTSVNGSVNILVDLTLSLAPLSFIAKLQRPVPEKVLLAVLMGMGLLASAASIQKTMLIKNLASSKDILTLSLLLTIYGNIELFVGTMAACLPYTKTAVQRVLTRVGVNFSVQNSFKLTRWMPGTDPKSDGNRRPASAPSSHQAVLAQSEASVSVGKSLSDTEPGSSGESACTMHITM